MLRLSVFIAHFKCSRVSSQRSALTLMPLGKQSIRRGLRRSKNIVSITLPALGMARLCFGRVDKGCFPYWLMHSVSGSYCKQQNSSPPTIRFKTTSPCLSYRSRFSQKMPTRVVCCTSFKPFGSHTAVIYPGTCVRMWCARFTLPPRCSLTHRSMTWRSRCTVLSTLARVCVQHVGWTTGAFQFLSAASYPLWTSCTSQTLLYAAARSLQREHGLFENKCPLVLQLPRTETDGCLHESIAVRPLRTGRCAEDRSACLWRLPVVVGSNNCRTAQQLWTLPDRTSRGVPRGGFGGFKPPPPKFRSFEKAEPNSLFRGKYVRNRLVFLFHHPN
jgi:hypothetical protein